MNFRLSDLFFSVLIIAAAYGLYMVKWEVHELKRQSNQVATEIAQQQEALDILGAEWAYLNRPERLQALAEKYLTLKPEAGQQMVDIAKIAQMPETVQTAEAEGMLEDAHLAAVTSTAQGF